MQKPLIRFDDGAAYEEFMGVWSRIVGPPFLEWLAPEPGLRWLDVGCGNGAFTEMLVARCAPLDVRGIDPSPEQLEFARTRCPDDAVHWDLGDAMTLPYPAASFDAAVMALVLFFVPEPALGVAEMARVVRPGGSVSTYAWDILGGGFPFAILQEEMARKGVPPTLPPTSAASRLDAMEALWDGAGLVELETRVVPVARTFASFDAFWDIARTGPRISPGLKSMTDAHRDDLRDRVRDRLPAAADGSIVCTAHANAIKGRVPRP